jgi:hypothetical protein
MESIIPSLKAPLEVLKDMEQTINGLLEGQAYSVNATADARHVRWPRTSPELVARKLQVA